MLKEPSSPLSDLRSQRLNGVTATWAASCRLRGYLQSPEGVSHRPLKLWLALTRRRFSQSAEALAGCPKTTSKPIHIQIKRELCQPQET